MFCFKYQKKHILLENNYRFLKKVIKKTYFKIKKINGNKLF